MQKPIARPGRKFIRPGKHVALRPYIWHIMFYRSKNCCYWKSWSCSDYHSWRPSLFHTVIFHGLPGSADAQVLIASPNRLETGPLPNMFLTLCWIFFWLATCVVEFERVNFAPPSVDISCRVYGISRSGWTCCTLFSWKSRSGSWWKLQIWWISGLVHQDQKEEEEEEKECITLHNQNQQTPAGISKSLMRLLPRRWFFPQ